MQSAEVRPASCRERLELVQLCYADSSLHVGQLQVVADVGVDVLVVITPRQLAKFVLEAFAAGVLLTGSAPAVATPVAERLCQYLQAPRVGEHAAPLAHRDVVSGIEADRREIAEAPD